MNLHIGHITIKAIKDRSKLLLFFLWFFHVINNYVWLKIDTYPLIWDASMHFTQSLQIFDFLQKLSVDSFLKIVTVSREYSYFVPLITALFYTLLGRSPDIGVFINGSIFLGILIFSVYGITKNIDNKKSGLLAAFLVTAYPMIFGHSRVFMYDLPLTAMVCLTIYTFQVTDNFRKRGPSLFFGLSFGLGIITKFTFIVFVVAAFSYYIYKSLSEFMHKSINKDILLEDSEEYTKQKINFLSAILIALMLASTWYLPNLYDFLSILLAVPKVYGEVHNPVFSLESLLYYFFRLINYQISFFLFLVFVMGFLYFIKIKLQNKIFLVFWIIIPYVIFTFLYYKSVRYTLPYLPAIAIISSIGISRMQHKSIRLTVIAIIIVVAVVQFFAYSYGIKFLPSVWKVDIFGNTIFLFNQEGGENALEQHRNPRKEDWKEAEVLSMLESFIKNEEKAYINLFVIPIDPRIHGSLLPLAIIKKVPVHFYMGSEECISLAKSDYVVIKDSKCITPPNYIKKIEASEKWFEENIDKFTLIKKINLPDNSNLLIYKQN